MTAVDLNTLCPYAHRLCTPEPGTGWHSPVGSTCKPCPANTFCVSDLAHEFAFATVAAGSLPDLIVASKQPSTAASAPRRGYFSTSARELVLEVVGGAVMPSVHPGFYAAPLDEHGRWTEEVKWSNPRVMHPWQDPRLPRPSTRDISSPPWVSKSPSTIQFHTCRQVTQESRWAVFSCMWPGIGCTGGSVFQPKEMFSPSVRDYVVVDQYSYTSTCTIRL